MRDWLVGLVARLPVGVHVKLLLAAFLAIAVLLIAEGAVGLGAVMAVTASAMTHDRPRILAAGFDGYQTKPISVRELLEAVRVLLDQPCRENMP